jgi:UDP-glucose 4-epimerase
MDKALVTGGAGFIGSHVAEILVNRNYQVTTIDDLSGGFRENITQGVEFIEGSITDNDLITCLFKEKKFDYVFHLAAYAAEGLSHFIKRFNYNNNLIGSVNLINAAVNTGVKCFVFTSSIAVYGASPKLPMTETIPPHPEDSYGIAKLAVEQELQVCKDMFELDYIVFRPHNVYGEHQNIGDKYRNVVGIFMNQALQNLPMTIFGDGEQKRAFSYISDVAPIIARSIETPNAYNQIFNVGAETPYTVNELAETVALAMEVEPTIKHLPARNEVKYAYSSHEKVQKFFGAHQPVTLDEGVRKMATWVQEHGSRKSQKFENIEVNKNFPVAWLD